MKHARDTTTPGWDTKDRCICDPNLEFATRQELWNHVASDAVKAMLADGGPTAPAKEFIAAATVDGNLWWRIQCGHHENLFDEVAEQLDSVMYVIHGVADRDPDELVCMFFHSEEAREQFKLDLPGRYAELKLVGAGYDAVSIIN